MITIKIRDSTRGGLLETFPGFESKKFNITNTQKGIIISLIALRIIKF